MPSLGVDDEHLVPFIHFSPSVLEYGNMGRLALWAIWILQLLVSFLATFAIIGTMFCANVAPMLLSVVSKKSSRMLSAAINSSTWLM